MIGLPNSIDFLHTHTHKNLAKSTATNFTATDEDGDGSGNVDDLYLKYSVKKICNIQKMI